MIAWALLNWQKVLLLSLVIMLAVYIGVLKLQLGHARSKLEIAQTELVEWKRVYNILAEKVVEQNAAVQELEKQKKAAIKKRAQADKKAAPIVAQAQHKENAIASVPASSGACESELQAIKQMVEAAK